MNRTQGYPSLQGRRRVVVPIIAAAIVLVVHVVLQLLISWLNAGLMLAQNNLQYNLQNFFPALPFISLYGIQLLAFAVGVFVCFWLLTPIAAELRLGQVVGRSLVAAAVGGLVWFLLQLALSWTENFDRSAASAFGWISGLESTVSSSAGWLFTNVAFTSLTTVVNFIPLTVLAGVIAWSWLREHPAAASITGDSHEV